MSKDFNYSLSLTRKEYLVKILKRYTFLSKHPLWLILENDLTIEPTFYTEYCKVINNNRLGRLLCIKNQENLFSLVKTSKSPEFSQCKCNLIYLGAPVRYQSEIIGVVASCQILLKNIGEKEYKDGLSLASKIGIENAHLFAKSLNSITVIPKGKIRWVMDSLVFLSGILEDTISRDKKLYEITTETNSMREEIKLMHEINMALNAFMEIKEIIKMILEQVMKMISVKVGLVIIKSGKIDNSEVVIASGISEDSIKEVMMDLKREVVDKIGNFIMINDLKRNPNLDNLRLGISSLLCIPLRIKGEVFGVMGVAHREIGEGFNDSERRFMQSLATEAAILIENANLHKESQDLFLETIKALTSTIDAKDPYTHGHSERVHNMSSAVADEMLLPIKEKAKVKLSALLHDIGKIGVTEKVLGKNGPLEDDEYETIKKHIILGADIIRKIKKLQEYDIVSSIEDHHERFDGKGYPGGFKGKQISLAGRIISVVDSYDAMISDRPYRKSMSKEKAINEIKKCAGSQFDPEVVEAFVMAFKKGKI
ncbi:MAG: HD domain-containing protein [bacterium]|nr:HD domain-containing protein [bacterium]